MRRHYHSARAWVGETFAPLRPVYDAWMSVISGFSWLLARVVLVLLFFTVMTVYGVVLRVVRPLGIDPMNRRVGGDESTYWTDTTVTNDDLSDFERQY